MIAVIAALLLAVVVAFQLALAAGAPWASAAYGGRAVRDGGRLPNRYRIASGVAALALLGIGWLILAAGSVLDPGPLPDAVLTVVMWVLVGLFVLNTAGNMSGRHPIERWGMSGLTAALAVLCVLIALSR